MSTTMPADQRAQLGAALQARRDALRKQLADHLHGQTRAERAREVAQQDNDDAPQRAPEREIAMALTDHERAELAAVDDALARLQSGRYGVCVDCQAAIPFERLRAEPLALRCMDCARRHERTARG